jgi:membrane-bound serine protease (ClpP class)
MKKFFLILFISVTNYFPQTVYVARIDGDIDLGLAPYINRVINEATEKNADAIIFEINTFGGRVDAATQIKDAILQCSIPTIAFVHNRAISAGALITLSCKYIVMAPGSSIGATTVVDQEGKKQSEKYQSYMRGEMRSTAEKNGRRTDIAEGMVDESINVADLGDDSTKLITLTTEEAIKFKIADTTAFSIKEVLFAFNLGNAKIISISSNWAEDVVRFLNNPIVSSMLIMVGLIGLYTEIKTPGFGFAGIVALVALTLFFGSSFILQLASVFEITLFIIGVILLIAEIFFIPGFGIPGIIGIIFLLVSLFLALINTSFYFDFDQILVAIVQLGAAVAVSVIVMIILVRFLPKTSAFNQFVLADQTAAKDGFTSHPDYYELINLVGEAATTLRPSGTALINNKKFDVVTQGEFIEKGKKIIVDRVDGLRIVVKEVV